MVNLPRIIPKDWLGPRRNQATPGNHRHIVGTMREGYISEPLFQGEAPANTSELVEILVNYGLDDSAFGGGGGGGGDTILHHNEILKDTGIAVDTEYTLTYLCSDEHWPHVVVNGVSQTPGVDYQYDFFTGVLTIDPEMDLLEEELLWVRYDHYNEVPPVDAPDEIDYIESGFEGVDSTSFSMTFDDPTEEDDFIVVIGIAGDGGALAMTTAGYTMWMSHSFSNDETIYMWAKSASAGETGVAGTFTGSPGPFYRRCVGYTIFRPVTPITVLDITSGAESSGTSSTIPQISDMGEGEIAFLGVYQVNGTVSGSPGTTDSPWNNLGSGSGAIGKHSIKMAYHITASDGDSSPNGSQAHLGTVNSYRDFVFRLGS